MGAFLSVAKGSIEEPWFLEVVYNGSDNKESQPLALVGKGPSVIAFTLVHAHQLSNQH